MDNTINYNLKKPASTDFYDIQDQNDNMDVIDQELKNARLAVNNELSVETAELFGVGTVDDALKRAIVDFSSYQAFCANVNADSINSAIGKNNEDLIHGMGLQLSMYAWYKGSSKTVFPFNVLKQQALIADVLSVGREEAKSNEHIINLLINSYLSTVSSQLMSNYPLITAMGEGKNGEILIGLSNGKVCTTTDFITFTTPVSVGSNTKFISHIVYEPAYDKYICRTTHDIFYSTNWSAWTVASTYVGNSLPRSTYILFRKAIGANRYYSTWWDNGVKTTVTSGDGVTWTTVSGGNGFMRVVYRNGMYYGFAEKNTYTSVDGITFTTTTAFTNIAIRDICFHDGTYYVGGLNGIYKTTTPETEASYVLVNNTDSAKDQQYDVYAKPLKYVENLYGKPCDMLFYGGNLISHVGVNITAMILSATWLVSDSLILYSSDNLYKLSNRLID